jgi:hypothetical protein
MLHQPISPKVPSNQNPLIGGRTPRHLQTHVDDVSLNAGLPLLSEQAPSSGSTTHGVFRSEPDQACRHPPVECDNDLWFNGPQEIMFPRSSTTSSRSARCAVRGWDSRKLVHMDGEKTELDATVGSACSVRG